MTGRKRLRALLKEGYKELDIMESIFEQWEDCPIRDRCLKNVRTVRLDWQTRDALFKETENKYEPQDLKELYEFAATNFESTLKHIKEDTNEALKAYQETI